MDRAPGVALMPETELALLLCGSLGRPRAADPRPLSVAEFARVLAWLERHGLTAEDLLAVEDAGGWDTADLKRVDPARIVALLRRGSDLIGATERWRGRGIWVLSRENPAYPARVRERLGQSAPPLLYGAGSVALPSMGGLVMVGSRRVDGVGLEFTRRAAAACAADGLPVVSGGARGVDREAMTAAMRAGGYGVVVVAHGLAAAVASARYREHLRAGRLTLISPFDPDSAFSVGNAMGRNKVTHALGDWSLVVSAAANTGGTWTGAREHLRRGTTPLLVRTGPGVPEGNPLLIELGGVPFDPALLDGSARMRDLLPALAPDDRPLASHPPPDR